MRRVPVPRTLDASPRFLFWDFDVIAVAAFAFVTGLILGSVWLGIVLTACATRAWSRARAGRGAARGFALFYWHAPLDVFVRAAPSSRRHFAG